jgi:hypothetical protein
MPHFRSALLAALAIGLIGPIRALGAPPTVESVVPGVGQVGREFTVVLGGGRLKDARELLLYHDGLTCTRLEAASDNEVRATLKAAAGARPGPHAFRVRTPGGLSELRVIHLVSLPVVPESEPNDDPKRAQAIPLNSTVAGVIDAGDVDCFAVSLRKGQRLSAEVQAVRLGGELTDTVLSVFAPDGRRLIEADDTAITRQDPSASLIAASDGAYTITVRDTAFGGGPANTYALHVGEFPRPSGVFPPGGQAGKPTRLELLGLEGSGARQILIPPDHAGPWFDYYPSMAGWTVPTAIPLRVRSYPCVEETDPGGATPLPDRLDAHDWPVAFHGVIGGRGDVDAFAVRAHSGQTIQVEVFAARVGSPLDSILKVYDPDGDLVGRNDDDATHDSRLTFQARTDGPYRVEIRDKRLEGGPGYVYRIEVEERRPSLTLFLAGPVRKSQARQVIAVPRGNRVLAHLGVRRDGFRGPVRIETGPLPVGVSIDLKDIPQETYLSPVVIEAAADAPLAANLVALNGSASTPAGPVTGGFAQVVDLLPGAGDSSFESIRVDRLAAAVIDEAPYKVDLASPASTLARDGAIEVLAKVGRAEGFDEALEVSLPYLPPGVEMDGPAIVPPGQGDAVLRLIARPDADPASWRLAAEARPAPPRRDRRDMTLALMAQLNATGGGGSRRRRVTVEGQPHVASRFVTLDLEPAPVTGRFNPAMAEQGRTVAIACAIEHARPLPAAMMATLEGLPARAVASPVPVTPDARRIEFRVVVAADAAVGRYESLAARLSGRVDGRSVEYRVGQAGRLEIHPAGALMTGGDGRPMSPLDALRAREATAGKGPPQTAQDH